MGEERTVCEGFSEGVGRRKKRRSKRRRGRKRRRKRRGGEETGLSRGGLDLSGWEKPLKFDQALGKNNH